MKTFLKYVAIIAAGILIGTFVNRVISRYHSEDTGEMVIKKDTVFIYDTIRFSKDDLAGATTELPPPSEPEYIYVPEVVIKTDVIHDTTYVVLQRGQYYTEKDGLCIWHSGVQSRIDSVDYVSRSYVIKQTYQKQKRNAISAGLEASYMDSFRLPFKAQYTRDINDWFAVYGFAEYDLMSKRFGGGIGGKVKFTW